jgi:hypothetical protein
MPRITRPAKALGHITYQEEVAAGKLEIVDAEIDADLNNIYQLADGALDDENINRSLTGVKIQYAKLNLSGLVRDADISLPTDFSGAGGISGNKIKGTIPSSALGPGSVTRTTLALAATMWDNGRAHRSDLVAQNGNTAFNNYLTTTCQARSAFGPLLLIATAMGSLSGGAGGVDINVRFRVRQEGNTLYEATRAMRGDTVIPWSCTYVDMLTAPDTAEHNYYVDIYQPGPNFSFNQLQGGSLVLLALS